MKQVVLARCARGNPQPDDLALIGAPLHAAFSAVFADNSFVGKLLVKVSEPNP